MASFKTLLNALLKLLITGSHLDDHLEHAHVSLMQIQCETSRMEPIVGSFKLFNEAVAHVDFLVDFFVDFAGWRVAGGPFCRDDARVLPSTGAMHNLARS